MNQSLKTLFAGALFVVAAFAVAQGPGGQGPGGPGMGRGPRMGMGMGMGMGTGFMLMRQDVQNDLKLTADQKTKIEAINQKYREQMRSRMGGPGGGPGGPGGDWQARMEEMRKMMEAQDKEINQILTPQQQKRMKEIRLQLMGAFAFNDPEIRKELGLTSQQISRIEELQRKAGEANMALFQRMRNNEITREQGQQAMQNNQKVLETETLKVLTPEQQNKLKAMKGAEFKRQDPPGGMFGGFGGNRQRGGGFGGAGGGRN
ncbi:MAG: hypothetical protein N2109_05390 [Fimbriimonadales bacterium]|nr:hypothetical protein [Fimbriimonadales bacterium]